MHAFSIVRFRVKPGRKEDFIEAHRNAASGWPGLVRANLRPDRRARLLPGRRMGERGGAAKSGSRR